MKIRCRLVWLCALLLIVLVGCNAGETATPVPSSRTLTIQSVEGAVEVTTARGKTTLAQPGQVLSRGDELRTYANGSAVLEMDDGTVVVVAENTLFEVEIMAGEPSNPITRFFVNVGSVFSFRQGELPPEATFEIDTPSGVATIRGSSVGVSHGLTAGYGAAGAPAHARPVAQIGGTSRVTCLEGHCVASGAGQTSDLAGGEGLNIDAQGNLGSVEPMTQDDWDGWREAFGKAQGAGLLPGAPEDEWFPPPPELPSTIPDLVGRTLDEAGELLAALGLDMAVADSQPCTNAEAGQVTIQYPPAGAPLQPGTVVEVVECTGPPGTGDVQVTLTWNTDSDLDLHVIDPTGEEIYFGNSTGISGGQLDMDANFPCTRATAQPAENIFWPPGGAPRGEYNVYVTYWSECTMGGPTTFTITIILDGQVHDTFTGTLSEGDASEIFTFTY